MTSEIMNFIDEVIDLRKFKNETWNKYEKELQMWRNKFLDSREGAKNDKKLRMHFLMATPEHIMRNGPEVCILEIQKLFVQEFK